VAYIFGQPSAQGRQFCSNCCHQRPTTSPARGHNSVINYLTPATAGNR